MADYAVNIVLKAQDEATATIRKLIAETRKIRSVSGMSGMGGMGARAGSGGRGGFVLDPSSGMIVPIAAGRGRGGRGPGRKPRSGDIGGFFQDWDFDMGRVAANLGGASANISRLTDMTKTAVGTPLELAMNFEQAMFEVRAVTSDAAIGSNFDALTAKARQLGRDTEFTASQVASALKYMGMAGFDTNTQLATLSPLLDAATISGDDLGQVSDVVTDVMGGFGLSADDARMAVDSMTATTLNANTNLMQLGRGLFKVGPLAKKVGVDIHEVNAMLGVLASAGIKGAEGGTVLRNVLLGIAGGTKDLNEEMQKAGLTAKEAKAVMDGLNFPALRKALSDGGIEAALGELDRRFKGLSPELQLFASQVIFGKRTAAGATEIISKLSTGYADLHAKVEDSSGASAKAAAEFRSTHKNSVTQLKSALEDLGITVGDELMPVIEPLIEDAKSMTKSFAAWAKENPELVRTLGKVAINVAVIGSVLAPVLLGLSSFTSLVTVGSFALKAFGGSAKIARVGLGGIGKMAATTGPQVSTLIGSRAGLVGLLGGAAAAAAMGYAFGSWADDTFEISDQLSGLNTEMSIHNELQREGLAIQIGLSKVRGAALLGSLTEQERKDLDSAKRRKEQLSAELAENEDDWGSIALGHDKTLFGLDVGLRGSDAINADIQRQQQIIDRINAAGIAREQRAEAQGLEVDPTDMRILRPDEGTQQAALLKAAEAMLAAAQEKSKVELTVRADGAKVTGVKSGSADVSVETGTLMGGA